jgi:BlaI family transcriptional regulator, penicillinase repressor
VTAAPTNGRRAILDLAPLELDCLSVLWPLGEATVREVRDALAPRRARAYTTIMTILDRLAQKGVVAREKKGRAWVYRPVLSAEEARNDAVGQIVEHFFDGSPEALAAHLAGDAAPLAAQRPLPTAPRTARTAAPRRSQGRSAEVSRREAETPPTSPSLDTTLL